MQEGQRKKQRMKGMHDNCKINLVLAKGQGQRNDHPLLVQGSHAFTHAPSVLRWRFTCSNLIQKVYILPYRRSRPGSRRGHEVSTCLGQLQYRLRRDFSGFFNGSRSLLTRYSFLLLVYTRHRSSHLAINAQNSELTININAHI